MSHYKRINMRKNRFFNKALMLLIGCCFFSSISQAQTTQHTINVQLDKVSVIFDVAFIFDGNSYSGYYGEPGLQFDGPITDAMYMMLLSARSKGNQIEITYDETNYSSYSSTRRIKRLKISKDN